MNQSKISFLEQRERGDKLFPFDTYHFENSINTSVTSQLIASYHWHPELEIVFVEKGNLKILLETEEYIANEGDIFFINSGVLHSMYTVPEKYFNYTALVFNMNLLNFQMYDYVQSHHITPLLSGSLKFPVLLKPEHTCSPECISVLKHIISVYEERAPFYQFDIKLSLYRLLLHFFQNKMFLQDQPSVLSQEQTTQLKEILAYIGKHYQEKLYLADIAFAFHLSPKYFSRYFKKHFGQTFTEYLNAFRIEQSLSILQQKKYSISDAALHSGFESLSYYVKVFRNVMGMPPGEYRKHSF